jgi:hypothetical protein
MLENLDMNYWGLFAMPLGLFVCFAPVLVAWYRCESKPSRPENQKDNR